MSSNNDLTTRRMPRGRPAGFASDPEAFEAFYCEHIDAVQRFVARRVADRDVVADLTADVFVAAIESAETYRSDQGAPIAWLYGIAQIVVSSRARRDGRERRATARVLGRELLDVDDIARIDDRLAAEQHSRRLYEAMNHLPDGERAVLELVALDDLSLAQAATVLSLRPVTARVRLYRARRRLSAQLAGSGAEELLPALKPKETPS